MMAVDWIPAGPFSMTNGQVEGIPDKPVVGAFHTIVAHPFDPNILWAGGTNSGLWKTNDALSPSPNWTPLIDDQLSLSIGALVLDSADPNSDTLYAGNGQTSSYAQIGGGRLGLLKSTDGGDSWISMNGGGVLIGKNISGIAANGNRIVVSVNVADSFTYPNIGIFRSTNGGNSFSQISGTAGTGLPGGVAYDMAVDPVNPNTLYTSIVFPNTVGGQGIYKSVNGGANWTRVSNSAMNALITNNTSNIEISVGKANNIYAAILNSGTVAGIFRSGNGGTSWTAMDIPSTNENGIDMGLNPRGFSGPLVGTPEEIAGGQGNIHFSIVADPNNPNVVFVGGDRQPRSFGDAGSFPNSIGANDFSGRLFRGDASKAVGLQFVHITHRNDLGAEGGGTGSNTSPHADSREMVFDALGNLIEADDGGIYRRTLPNSDQGDWSSVIGNLQATEMHDVAYDSVSNVLISGNQDAGTTYQAFEGAAVWTSLSTGDGGDVVVDDISQAAFGRSVRYTSFQNLGGFRRTIYDANGVALSTAFPARTVVSGANLSPSFRTPMQVNSEEGTRLVIQGSNSIYESFDQGDTLIEVGAGAGNFGALEQDAIVYGGRLGGNSNPNVLWVGSDSDVFLRTTAGGPVSRVPSDPTTLSIRDLVVDPDTWTTAIVATTSQVLMTTNSGTAWTNITGNLLSLASNIHALAYIPGIKDVIVAGTKQGVFYTPAATPGVWTMIGNGLPNAIIFELEYDVADDILVVGTFGRGAWTIPSVSSEISTFFSSDDFGDAPDSYHTTKSSGGAQHNASGPTLGFLRDVDQDGSPATDALGDDSTGFDDEDGVVLNGTPILGQLLTMNVQAPDGGVLNAWFDTNRDGTFDDTEHLLDEVSLTFGDNLLGIDLPSSASIGKTYARFRITSSFGMATTPDGTASDGEVEDYSLVIRSRAPTFTGTVINGSFTNLNRSGLGTLQLRFDQPMIVANANAMNLVNRTTGQKINLASASLLGNGTASITWKLPASLVLPNGRYTYELAAAAVRNFDGVPLDTTAAGQFHILFGDVNGDVKVDQADYILSSDYFSSKITNGYRSGDANGDARVNATDLTLIRASYSSSGLPSLGLDFGDADESGTSFGTTLSRDGARSAIVAGPILGLSRDAESDGQPQPDASGDGTDEDGVIFSNVEAGAIANASIAVNAPGFAFLNAWIDFNGDGDWGDLGEHFLSDFIVTSGVIDIPILLPTERHDKMFARFRINAVAGYGFSGFAADGEVEDYVLNTNGAVGPPLLLFSNTVDGRVALDRKGEVVAEPMSPPESISFRMPPIATPVVPNGLVDSLIEEIGFYASQLATISEKKLDPLSVDRWYESLSNELDGVGIA